MKPISLLMAVAVTAACDDSLTEPAMADLGAPAAAIAATGGSVNWRTAPPASVVQGKFQSNTHVFAFDERSAVTLATGVEVDVTGPGRYDSKSLPARTTLPAGTRVNSHFVHADHNVWRTSWSRKYETHQTFKGAITFDSEIVGVILSNRTLNASDAALGAVGTQYPGSDMSRRTVSEEAGDWVEISADRRTISFSVTLGTLAVDQIRVLTAAPPPADVTPPSIVGAVEGDLGENGWYVSDVKVSWTVTDNESAYISTGCDAATVSDDTAGTTFTCEATSAGGTASKSITVKRDATVPEIAFEGNAGSYTVDQTVAITCSTTDAMSGIAAATCPGATGDAYTFPLGENTLEADARDNAGLTASATASFTVIVTTASLSALTERWVTNHGVAKALVEKLEAAANARNAGAKKGALQAYRNHLRAQADKHLTAEHAAILSRLSESL